ncbi:ATP-binding protein [Janthinobacterium sp. 75]|uniref:ATP-dependent nuclease n=1 Tax=Janthinobacterium sp. 75 TaxID=2135628 RepID=UPI001063C977|nr:ATP-binding protein [Janthinobacterium sp. 75]TDY36134.1 putative AbiEii toxin of type IV toxin-antitoxin system [Janthinobacterium sp. 75]
MQFSTEQENFQKPSASISKIKFSGGAEFKFKKNEKIILVGPNNSGKSQTLREIYSICKTGKTDHTVVISDLELLKDGSVELLKEFFEIHGDLVGVNYQYKNWQINEGHIQFWNDDFLIHGIADGFIKNISASERLTICNQQSSIAPGEQKSRPQHVLYDDSALMKKISGLFRRAFGKDIMFDYRGGSRIPIHVGELPSLDSNIDRVGDEYVQAIRKNPPLDLQGDGMKSYAGILFDAVVSEVDMTLIDEPEAFLHPPQMRRLGETLAAEVKGQLIVATHSSDIMRGFLEGMRGNVRILRIHRENGVNKVAEAASSVVKDLWEKPELRYSNALEGIFHEQTIICEDDSDCRLINCIADYMAMQSTSQWKDTAYVPTGGKHGVAKVASILRQVGVPVKAVFDIDLLSEENLLQTVVEAFGGDWTKFKPIWGRIDSAVRKGNKPKTVNQIKEEVISIINSAGPEELPKGDVIEAMKQGKAWSVVKKYGWRGIPNGDSQKVAITLQDMLEDIGVYLVPVGEIEDFCPQIGSHGPKFVSKLLSTVELGDACLNDLRVFVDRVHNGPHSN